MISVLIPTTTGGVKYLRKLLPQLKPQIDFINGEILISDNESNDGTEQLLKEYKIYAQKNPRNTTFSQANNKLFQLSKFSPLLLNNDTEVIPNFINSMLQATKNKPTYGIFGCPIYRMQDRRIHHAGVYFTQQGVPYELGLPVGDINGISNTDPRVKESREVPSVTGACMLIRRQLYIDLGGLDEHYRTGWEDTDFVLRARERGVKVWYNGETELYHHHFGSKEQGRLQFESQNRQFYDSVWVTTGRANKVLRKDNFI